MPYHNTEKLTLGRHFLEPANSTHRQYEALRAYYVEGLTSVQVAERFGYTPGSFRVLAHQFSRDPKGPFFLSSERETKPRGKRQRLREKVVALRKQNLSVDDISRTLTYDGEPVSPATILAILKEEGFARLPRRLDEERPERPRPTIADAANVRELNLSPRSVQTDFGGLFLFVPLLVEAKLSDMARRAGLPGSKRVPADAAIRALLALKLFGKARHSHLMSHVLDEGLALFAGLNVIPKRSFLSEYSCRIDPKCYPKWMRAWFGAFSDRHLK